MEETVISIQITRHGTKYGALVIQNGVTGTHEAYNVVYNNSCVGEYFDSEIKALSKAMIEYIHNRER